MSMRTKGLSLVALGAAGLIAGVYWPSKIEGAFPGWTEKTASLRTALGGAAPAPNEGAAPAARGNALLARPPVPVNIDTVQRGPMAVRLDAVGVVQPVASVALKTRIDAQIEKIVVQDGAQVKAGDVLVKLDSRQIEAQIKQTESTIAKDQASLEQAQRDAVRSNDLFGRGAGTQTKADDALTQVASAKATLAADQACNTSRDGIEWHCVVDIYFCFHPFCWVWEWVIICKVFKKRKRKSCSCFSKYFLGITFF